MMLPAPIAEACMAAHRDGVSFCQLYQELAVPLWEAAGSRVDRFVDLRTEAEQLVGQGQPKPSDVLTRARLMTSHNQGRMMRP